MVNNSNGKILWILDNGHRVDTPGKRSPMLTDGRQFLEYRFNREVVVRMVSLLNEKNLRSHQIVPEEHDIYLSTRVARANKLKTSNICVPVDDHPGKG